MKKETLASYCAEQILNMILNGQLLPNEKIKGDYLKSYLNVGLSPIREALARLTNTHMVEFVDNIGFKVAAITHERLHDLYSSYAHLEAVLFKESIIHRNIEWESEVIAALYRLSKIEASEVRVKYGEWSVENERFHDILVENSQLQTLKNMRKQLNCIKEWYNNLAYSKMNHELISVNHQEHSLIVELAFANKIDSACNLLYKHTLHSAHSLATRLTRYGYMS